MFMNTFTMENYKQRKKILKLLFCLLGTMVTTKSNREKKLACSPNREWVGIETLRKDQLHTGTQISSRKFQAKLPKMNKKKVTNPKKRQNKAKGKEILRQNVSQEEQKMYPNT